MGPQHVTIDGLVGTLPLLTWAATASGDAALRDIARQDAPGYIATAIHRTMPGSPTIARNRMRRCAQMEAPAVRGTQKPSRNG